jgi:hypothetical protein
MRERERERERNRDRDRDRDSEREVERENKTIRNVHRTQRIGGSDFIRVPDLVNTGQVCQ